MSDIHVRVDNREIRGYFTALNRYLTDAVANSASGKALPMAEAVNQVIGDAQRAHAAGNKVIFVGTRWQRCHRQPHGD